MRRLEGNSPDFFILGAPKCGTSTLYEMLRVHPSVFLPESKVEPHYFSTDIALNSRHPSTESYLSMFRDAPVGAIIGEASTWYLYSEDAVENIMNFNPVAKCIVLLRNPVDMAQSLHAFNLVKHHEDVREFELAWSLQSERRQGRRLPTHVIDPAFVQYYDACALADSVERFLDIVPASQRLVLIYEDFFSDPVSGFSQVCTFLGIPPVSLDAVPHANPRRSWRNRKLAEFLDYPPRSLRVLYGPAKRVANSIGLHPLRMINRLNASSSRGVTMRAEFRDELLSVFSANNEKMRRLLNASLEKWLV